MFQSFVLILLLSFMLSALLGIIILPWLKRLKARQTEREEGPASHKVKTETPTMGGFIFLIPFLVLSAACSFRYRALYPVIIGTLLFGAIGFLDDYIKVIKKRNLGLRAYQKIILQLAAAVVLLFSMSHFTEISFDMLVPFSLMFSANAEDLYIGIGPAAVPFLITVVLGTVNGANFTDGLDGLLSCVTLVICFFIAVSSVRQGIQVSLSAAAMAGALLGFLIYNKYPAKVFMGDTGSLALGGFVASSMLMMKMTLFIPIAAFIYFAEVLSVILQVAYFKATKGKRIFRMAPIHHHFELGGWSEVKVVRVFTAITAALCLISYFAY